MEEGLIQPKRRTFVKAAIVLLGILSVVGVTFFIYSRQVVDKAIVINGIAVPPEPDPTINNGTLAGVDSNSNGVRDDVERMIARKVSNASGFSRALVVARAYQRLLVSATVSQAESDTSMLEVECFVFRNLTDPTGIRSAEIKTATFNTPARLEDIRKKVLYLNPRITDTKHECEVGQLEVINGISVPPEPDPSINNATLAGVDSNVNGVRDDVERILAQRLPNVFNDAMQAAKHTQLLLTNKGSSIDPELAKRAFCLMAREVVDGRIIIPTVLNTEDRQGAYQDNVGLAITYQCE